MTDPVAPRSGRGGLNGPEVVGIALIGLGALFLLDRFGWFSIGWGTIWPLLLVGVGVLILAGSRGWGAGGETTISVPRDGSDQLELELRLGAGRFLVTGGAAELVEATSTAGDVVSEVRRDGRRARVRIAPARPWFPFTERGAPEWRIAVAPDIPTRLDAAMGAGDFELDLSDVRVVDARISVGAAQARITLPRPVGEVPIRVSTGASQVTFTVPAGVESQVLTSGGMLDVSGPLQSAGFATAVDRVAVRVEGGAASIRVI